MRDIETILGDNPENWSEDDYKIITDAQNKMGRQRVKALRDRILNPPKEEPKPEEQIVS